MWEPVSKEKYERNKRRRLRETVGEILACGLIYGLVSAIARYRFNYDPNKSYFYSWEEILSRLPYTVVFSLLAAALIALCYVVIRAVQGDVQFLLCPQCETIKRNDGKLECSCGGRFADLDSFDWNPESDPDKPAR